MKVIFVIFLKILKTHIKQTGKNIEVYSVNGKFTKQLRTRFGLEEKDRNKDNSHHAVDAMLIAVAPRVMNQIPSYIYYIKDKELKILEIWI